MKLQAARTVIRDALGWALYSAGITRPNAKTVEQLTIVTFHRVLASDELKEYPLPGLAVTPEELAWFIGFFRKYFEILPLSQAVDAWRNRESKPTQGLAHGHLQPASDHRPLMAVTFDDALRDNFRHARPVLERAAVKATFFVPIEAVEDQTLLWHDRMAYLIAASRRSSNGQIRDLLQEFCQGSDNIGDAKGVDANLATTVAKTWTADRRMDWIARAQRTLGGSCAPAWDAMMTWEQLRMLASEGHEIGSHSWTHPILPRCSDKELEREIVETRSRLEQRVGAAIETFCYPNGDWDQRCLDAVRRSGFRAAVTTTFGVNRDSIPVHLLRRCDIQSTTSQNRNGSLSEARVAWRLSRWSPGALKS